MSSSRLPRSALVGAALFVSAASADAVSYNISSRLGDMLANVQAMGPTTFGTGTFVGVGCAPGVACGIAGMLDADVEAERLVKPNFQIAELQTPYGIITLKGRTLSPSATKFIALLRAAEVEIVQAESQRPVPQVTLGKAAGRRRNRR